MKTIFVIGGDGYCGWPLSLMLATEKYKVVILDSLVRRKIDLDLGIDSLVPIFSIKDRVEAAAEHNLDITFEEIDILNDAKRLRFLIKKYLPSSVVNMAHQRSVPISSLNFDACKWTIENNLLGQMTLLEAVKDIDPAIKIIHLGSLGVFGYRDINGPIPVGKIETQFTLDNKQEHKTRAHFNHAPDSIYHLSKSLNSGLNDYYLRVHKLNIIDVFQATVWGCDIGITDDERLNNRLDVDPIYGTVINRFCHQSSQGEKLTVYGSGKQQRGFIHIYDSTKIICELIKASNSDSPKYLSSVTDIFDIRTLAINISNLSKTGIEWVDNNRYEAEEEFQVFNIKRNEFKNIEKRISAEILWMRQYSE